MEICGISCVTNLAAGMTSEQLNHEEVQANADRVSSRFKALVTEIIKVI
jgi:purine-nucleoside phosphorylase